MTAQAPATEPRRNRPVRPRRPPKFDHDTERVAYAADRALTAALIAQDTDDPTDWAVDVRSARTVLIRVPPRVRKDPDYTFSEKEVVLQEVSKALMKLQHLLAERDPRITSMVLLRTLVHLRRAEKVMLEVRVGKAEARRRIYRELP